MLPEDDAPQAARKPEPVAADAVPQAKPNVYRGGSQAVVEREPCPQCGSLDLANKGKRRNKQRWQCRSCGKSWTV